MDVGNAIGMMHQHKALLDHVAQESHAQDFEDLTEAQQGDVREDAEEHCTSCTFLKQHSNLKVDLQNDFTTGDHH